jgi:glycosyltransferase involved in cell wall biosynthesis
MATDDPIRVVTVVPSIARNTGGPATTIIQGTRAMGDSVKRVIYATDAAQPAATRPFRRISADDLPEGSGDVPVRIFRSRPPYQLAFSPALWAALRRDVRDADVVTIHSLNLFPQYAAFTAALRAGVPYVVTPHGALDPWITQNSPLAKRLVNALWQRKMLQSAAAIHFTTAEEAGKAGELTAGTPQIIVPNGLDLGRFTAPGSGERFRRRFLKGHGGAVVLFLGRIAGKKGIDLLIRAFAAVADRRDCLLAVAGPDDEKLTSTLRGIAREVGVARRVVFVGPLYGQDQIDALSAADIWALTSHTENFGNAVIEAMAAGCPVLVSTEVDLAPQIKAASAGIVTPLDVDLIASAMGSLLVDPDLRAQLASRARVFAAQFDWAVVAPRLVAALRNIALARRPAEAQE